MARQIIYLLSYAPTAWDATRFGFDILKAQRMSFRVYDLSALIETRKNSDVASLAEPYIEKIYSIAHFELLIKKNGNHVIYIDEINGLNGFQWRARKVYRLFKKYHISYYLVEIGCLPLLNNQLSQSWIKRCLNKLKKARHVNKIFQYTAWQLGKCAVNMLAKYLHYYQLPKKIFSTRSDLLDFYLKRYALRTDIVVPIHSFDYDRYLTYLAHRSLVHTIDADVLAVMQDKHSDIKLTLKPYAVFLDQALAVHSDFGNSVMYSPVTPEKYIKSLNHFFDLLAETTSLSVVIAASPRAKINYLQQLFPGKKIVKDQTIEYVANCSLVLMHTSTAVSFAVLFNKPILMLATQEILTSLGFANFLANMANALNLEPLCIDDAKAIATRDIKNYFLWEKNYDNYKYKYIMSKNLDDRSTWQRVIDDARL